MKKEKKSIYERQPILSIVLFVLILVVGIDMILGAFLIPENIHSFRAYHPYYHHTLLPNQKVRTTWDNFNYYTFYTNSLGFRDRSNRKVALKTEQRRLLIMGDSHTEGVGVKYEDSFAGILERRLAAHHIEVLNAAAVSYSPKLYYYKTKYLVEEKALQFSDLLVCIDISDIQNELAYSEFEPEKSKPFDSFVNALKRFMKNHSFTYWSLNNLVRQAELDQFYKMANREEKNPKTDLYATFFDRFHDSDLLAQEAFHNIGNWYLDREIFEKWGRDGLILEKWYMVKLAELCEQHKIRLFVCVYPWPVQIQKGDINSIQAQFWELFCQQNNARFINLFPLFFERLEHENVIGKYYIPGDVHFNEAGHRLVGDYLSNYFK